MTLISDLIDIPDRVHRGDFVLTLASAVDDPRAVLKDYVVTPQLVACFDDALSFVRDALYEKRSKAAYLHGSFGAGKSHFMAILHLILSGNVVARNIPELASVVAKHDWMEGRRILMVPYHMTGAINMESAILGQYAAHVARLYPGVGLPGVYLSEGLLTDALKLRQRMGDEVFFSELNLAAAAGIAAAVGGGGWGGLIGRWEGENFDEAAAAPPDDPDRQRLVGDLLASHFRSYAALAGAQGEGFVPLDDGLAAISRHAAGLGYDAVLLFLDELILWLASRSADLAFVTKEGVKLSKLVESHGPARDLPIVSFVARQRDLRELVGEHVAGAEQLKFADVLKYWEARFHKITLEDRNLPEIANRRVMRPRSDADGVRFRDGVKAALKLRPAVLDTLLAGHYTVDDFAKVYPFSPALVDTLVGVSSVLQRERTALKLLLQLLVDKRDTLKLGDIVPVGDLFDVIAEGDEPFSEAMKIHFENARKLWAGKLLPLLEREHGVTRAEVAAGKADPVRANAFRNDGRILKTLLLAALVPEVRVLKELTPARIAALNHGTIASPIAGREGHEVLRRLQHWAREVGEIKLSGDLSAPVVTVHITGVDTAAIIANGERFDNEGNRRNKIREILYGALKVTGGDSFFVGFSFLWRGTERRVSVAFDNVREMSDERLRGSGRDEDWTIVVDFPFDAPGYGPKDDSGRLDKFRERHPEGVSTLVWMPSFFSQRALEDLKRLVIIDHLLTGDRFDHAASHLSQIDRVQARDLLRNQREQLELAMRMTVEQAYGIRDDLPNMVDGSLALGEHWRSLDGTFRPRPPVGAGLRDGFVNMLGQLFAHLCPGHPDFGEEIKTANLRKALEVVEAAVAAPDGLVPVESKFRAEVRRVVNPMKLGEMHEQRFELAHSWRTHFLRRHAEAGGPLTAGAMRGWIRESMAGLPTALENLVILCFAMQDHRGFFLRGGPARPTLDQLADELELRQQAMPDAAAWKEAVRRAALLFGVTGGENLNPTNLSRLADDITAKARDLRGALAAHADEVAVAAEALGVAADAAPRLRSARSARALVDALATAPASAAVPTLATAELVTSEGAIMRLMGQAQPLTAALRRTNWTLFDGLAAITDSRRDQAGETLSRLAGALAADEHVQALEPVLDQAVREAVDLLTVAVVVPPSAPPSTEDEPPPIASPGPDPVRRKRRVVASGAQQAQGVRAGRALLDEIARSLTDGRRLTVNWQVVEDEG